VLLERVHKSPGRGSQCPRLASAGGLKPGL
jgi:hypothetical protein